MNHRTVKLLLLLVVTLGPTGCTVESNEPIRILGAVGMRGTPDLCNPMENDQVSGALDVSIRAGYLIAFRVESSLGLLTEQVGADTLSQGNRNDFYGDKMNLKYRTSPNLSPRLRDETLPVHMVVRAGATGGWVSFGSLLSEQVLDRLEEALAPQESIALDIEFFLSGKLGSGAPANSNTVVFPIRVFNSGFTGCGPNLQVERNGPCGRVGGQDEFPINCVAVTP